MTNGIPRAHTHPCHVETAKVEGVVGQDRVSPELVVEEADGRWVRMRVSAVAWIVRLLFRRRSVRRVVSMDLPEHPLPPPKKHPRRQQVMCSVKGTIDGTGTSARMERKRPLGQVRLGACWRWRTAGDYVHHPVLEKPTTTATTTSECAV